jgi:tetraacyldisaccharide 4'-kinase
VSVTSRLYAAVARGRRRWYARHPEARRRLDRPVVSVGNIAVGGSGKTPTAIHVARLLQSMGERPSVLTRGYARRRPSDGVTVVSDGARLLADLDRAGDEPLMIARQLGTVPVLVSADRALAGRLAERRFGCTVHVLDDGFQHFQLHRDVDLVLVDAADVVRPVTLPAGRLREPLDAARAASAVVVPVADQAEAAAVGEAVGVDTVFRLRRTLDLPRLVQPAGRVVEPAPGTRVLAVAGVARPGRFFAELAAAGWTLAGTLTFGDHHHYTPLDVARIAEAMASGQAVMVLTTEKDALRLLPLRPLPVPLAWVPLQATIEPADAFRAWLGPRIGRTPPAAGGLRVARRRTRPIAGIGCP